MKRYRFSVEGALRARRAQEDVARQRLAAANLRLQRAEAGRAQAIEAYQSAGTVLGLSDVDSFSARRGHELRLADSVEHANRLVREAQVEASTCFTAWVEVGKQVASLERLDERRRAEWEVELRREEAAAVDDVVSSRWAPLAPVEGGRK